MKLTNLCLLLTACLSTTALAQEKFELGKPNDANYRYLDEYKALKDYIDYSKYPNFKLGAGTTVDEYLKKSTVYNMTNKNFTETVAGNAMKMSSCVDNNGKCNCHNVHFVLLSSFGINIICSYYYLHNLLFVDAFKNTYYKYNLEERRK